MKGENFLILSLSMYPLSGKFIAPKLANNAAILEMIPTIATTRLTITIIFRMSVEVLQPFQ